jgi:hypothetical protein
MSNRFAKYKDEEFLSALEQPEVTAPTNRFTKYLEPEEEPEAPTEELPISAKLEAQFGSAEDYKSPAEHAQTAVSEGITTVSNMLMDGGMKLVKSLIPDEWEEGIVDFSRDKWESFAKLPGVSEGIAAAEEGMAVYNEWATENPDLARRMEEVINIGSVAGPKMVKTPDWKRADVQGRRAKYRNRRSAVDEMMEPIGKKGDGGIKINPDTKRKEYVYTPWEKKVNNEVVRTQGVNPKKPFTDNYNALLAKAEKMRHKLDAKISNRNAPVDRKALKTGLANKVNAIDEDTLLVGNPRDQAIRIYKHAQKLIDASDGSAMGILQARRRLDKWVRDERPKVFDSDYETAVGHATTVIREHMNDTVAKAMKEPGIRDQLYKQHLVLSGANKLEAKAYAEADTRFGRLVQKAEGLTGEKMPTTPMAQAVTLKVLGTGAAGLAGLVSGYKGLKWLGKPEGKAWLGKMRALAKQNPELKAEVLALTQLAQGLTPEDTDDDRSSD